MLDFSWYRAAPPHVKHGWSLKSDWHPTVPIFEKGIRDELRHIRKTPEQSMSVYPNKVENLYDNFSTGLGKPVDDLEIINTTSGMGPDYDAFINSFHVRENTSLG